MSDTAISITTLVSRFRYRAFLTWGLVLLEGIALILMPLAIGLAVDGILEGDRSAVIPLGGLCFALLFVGAGRRFYDTRAYAGIYRTVGRELVARERERGSSVSATAARVNLFHEFIRFLEESIPGIIQQLLGLVGTLVIIGAIAPSVLAGCLGVIAVTAVVYWVSDRRIFALNRDANDEFERQVDVLSDADPLRLRRHLHSLARCRIRLSDLETVNYSLIWLALSSLIVFTVIVVASSQEATFGQVLSAVMYVFGFTENLLTLPLFYQEVVRLREISDRLADDVVVLEEVGS